MPSKLLCFNCESCKLDSLTTLRVTARRWQLSNMKLLVSSLLFACIATCVLSGTIFRTMIIGTGTCRLVYTLACSVQVTSSYFLEYIFFLSFKSLTTRKCCLLFNFNIFQILQFFSSIIFYYLGLYFVYYLINNEKTSF